MINQKLDNVKPIMTCDNKPVEISRYEYCLFQIEKIYVLTEEGKKEQKENQFIWDEFSELYRNKENDTVLNLY